MSSDERELRAEIERLQVRIKTLTREKGNLQMAVNLIAKLSPAAGLDNVVERIARILIEGVGGSNITVYCRVEDSWHLADALGNRQSLDQPDDQLVLQALQDRSFVSASTTDLLHLQITDSPSDIQVWVYPLMLGERVIGAIRLDGMMAAHGHHRSTIDPFIQYATSLLYHEVANVYRLEDAYLEAKRAKNELRQVNQMLASVINSSPLAIIALDQNGIIKLWSPATERIFGWSEQAVLGRPLPLRPAGDSTATEPAGATGHEWLTDAALRCYHKDGSTVEISVSTAPVLDDADGMTVAVVADITKQRLLERQLRQSQKLEAIGTLAGGIAHDFNNVLAAVMGNADIALMELAEETTAHECVEEVMIAAQRAKSLVQQILAFSRQAEQGLHPVAVMPIVKEAIRMLRATLPSTIELKLEMAGDPGQVIADPTQLHQILINLCTNAHHAMLETGGQIKVTVERIELPEQAALLPNAPAPGWHLHLRVSDTGTGIAQEDIDRIFDPYFSTKSKGQGTGLGLAVVHGIITRLGGKVAVASTPGHGTSVEIYLPSCEARAEHSTRQGAEIRGGSEQILIIDDEESIARMGRKLLTSLGYQATMATGSAQALELFTADPDRFDLVITDQTMPGMTGATLAQEMLRIRPELPIILCTGFSELIDRAGAEAIGICAFLEKPFGRKALAKHIRQALDSSSGGRMIG